MRVIQLTAENIQRLVAIDVTLSDGVVEFSGKNGQGKTSALNCLWMAMGGKEAIPGQPIRKGQDKAKITLGLGDKSVEIVVKRVFTGTGTTLTVESPDGARYPSPQAMLDDLWDSLSVDPLAFSRMPPKEQAVMLRKVAKLDIDVDAIDKLNATDFDKRTGINREAKQKKAQADGVALPPEVAGEIVDESALVDELQEAGKVNADLGAKRERRDAARGTVDVNLEQTAKGKAQATSIRTAAEESYTAAGKAADEAYQRAKDAASATYKRDLDRAGAAEKLAHEAELAAADMDRRLKEAPPLPEPVDTTALRAKIAEAKDRNKAIVDRAEAAKRKADLAGEAARLEAESKALTATMDARNKEKDEAIRNAAMPVPGLGFSDGHVTYNGLPFDQASGAEQLQVSMAIAMAAKPKLRVIRITDGSLLDDDSMNIIRGMAKDEQYQVLIERVDSSGKVGIVIHDGAIVSTPESRALDLEEAK